MKIAYFDCFSGISGDMVLGSLVDLGLDLEELKTELQKLGLTGYTITSKRVLRNSISATKVDIDISEQGVERHLSDILTIIDTSSLDLEIKELAKNIFVSLGEVEAKIHNKSIESVHFHEVGAMDSIIDIVGSAIALKKLGVEKVYASKIQVGKGFIKTCHGTLPVPAPATIALLQDIPIQCIGIESELATPTGAAIIKNITDQFDVFPNMTLKKIGYGAGGKIIKELPNLLRVCLGETTSPVYETDEITLIETNIDDMNPEYIGYITELLMKKGALDVYQTNVFMKKNRPGVMISLLCESEQVDRFLNILFSETTTFGVRIQKIQRKKLAREIVSITTKYGEIKVKIGKMGNRIKIITPEYEDCKILAEKLCIPIKDVFSEAKKISETLKKQ